MQNKPNEEKIKYYAMQSLEELSEQINGLNISQIESQRQKERISPAQNIKKDTIGFRLRRSFINPFSVVLMVIAAISFVTDVLAVSSAGKNFTTILITLAMILVSGCVRFTQELKSKRITDKLLQIADSPVSVKRDGQWKKTSAEQLVTGDVVRISAGERVPADIRLTKVFDCFISESSVTGESRVQEKKSEKLDRIPSQISDCKNMAFCGTTVVNGFFEGIVIAAGSQTVYGGLMPQTSTKKKGYDQGTHSIAWVLIRFMVFLVPIVFIASGLTKGSWMSAFLFALSVAVGLTPELLPMVITACLSKGSFNMNRKKTVVKNVNAMQGFGNMDVLCVDKTGTLTEDTLLLEYYMDILGNENQQVLDSAYLNSFYHSGICNHLDQAILKVKQMPCKEDHYKNLTEQYKKLDEIPFDYSRKISSILLKDHEDSVLIAKGGADDILCHCRYGFYKGQKIEIDKNSTKSVHAIVDEMSEEGMKVLAVAVKRLHKNELTPEDESELTLIGYLAFFDAPKKTASAAIQKLNDLHVATKVLTGDKLDVALSVCRRLGMDVSKNMTGTELENLSDNDAQIRIEETVIFAELSPAQKAQIIEILQSNGHTVGFLADGMNDLPAVLKSDVGISVDTAVPSVKECADVLLLKKDLNVLESGITEGRCAFANMTKYVKITASSNLGNIIAIVFAGIFLPFFPMTSVQILLLNLLYDILCLVLPWDHVDREIIQRPMEWSGKTLSRFMLIFGPVSSLFDVITFLFLFYVLCPSVCGGAYYALSLQMQNEFTAVFQTGWFLESMWTQILILHLLRTDKLPFLQSKPSALMSAVTILGIAAFTVLAVTPVGRLIGLTALPSGYYVFLIVTVLCYLMVVTMVKKIYRKHYHSLI